MLCTVRTHGDVGVDDHVIAYLRYFGSWWHSGMKRPGLTLHVLAHETCSTLDMQLVLHKWLCGCQSLPL
jgi:hypothetical protein